MIIASFKLSRYSLSYLFLEKLDNPNETWSSQCYLHYIHLVLNHHWGLQRHKFVHWYSVCGFADRQNKNKKDFQGNKIITSYELKNSEQTQNKDKSNVWFRVWFKKASSIWGLGSFGKITRFTKLQYWLIWSFLLVYSHAENIKVPGFSFSASTDCCFHQLKWFIISAVTN